MSEPEIVAFHCKHCKTMGKLSPPPEIGEVLECPGCNKKIQVTGITRWANGIVSLTVRDVRISGELDVI